MTQQRMSHVFVEEIPAAMEQGVLYVSMEYATAIHLCACGCSQEVVTPLSPTDWSLTFDGEHVSLDHSIGNGSLPCGSHYFIRGDAIAWTDALSKADSARSRARDRRNKKAYFSQQKSPEVSSSVALNAMPEPHKSLETTHRRPSFSSSAGLQKHLTGWKKWFIRFFGSLWR